MKIRGENLKWQDTNMAKLDLTKLILHFEQSNKAEGKSPKTVSWYTEMLAVFVKFKKLRDKRIVLDEFNIVNARDFVIHEQQRGLSPFTIQARVRALKSFSSWLVAEGYTPYNPLINLKLPKVPINLIEPLNDDEVNKLVNVQNSLTAIGSRNIAILVTFLDTGLRINELSTLRSDDAHIEDGYLKVQGKGSRERIVPIGSLAQKTIWRYTLHFRPEPQGYVDNYLFLTLDGRQLKTNAIKLLLKRWGKRAGVPRLHAHLCRHTFATNFLIHKCGDTFRLQQILGHSSLEMSRRYVHYALDHAMIQGHVLSPMDHIVIKKLNGYKIDKLLKNKVTGH